MKITLEDDKIFSSNLSAFVEVARSVTWIMKVEFAHAIGFESWYEDKQKSMQYDDFEFFNEIRRAIVHINRVKPNKKVSIGIFESIWINDSVDRTVNRYSKSDGKYSSQETKKVVISNDLSSSVLAVKVMKVVKPIECALVLSYLLALYYKNYLFWYIYYILIYCLILIYQKLYSMREEFYNDTGAL
jgi:hypothetical protein